MRHNLDENLLKYGTDRMSARMLKELEDLRAFDPFSTPEEDEAWENLPLHIKITYQSQAQYERSIKRETAKR